MIYTSMNKINLLPVLFISSSCLAFLLPSVVPLHKEKKTFESPVCSSALSEFSQREVSADGSYQASAHQKCLVARKTFF